MRLRAMLIAVCVGILMVSSVDATISTVKLTNHNNQYSDTATLYGGGLSGVSAYTGIYSWTVADYTGTGEYFTNYGFCIELTQNPVSGWYTLTDVEDTSSYLETKYSATMTTAKASAIKELWGRYYDSSWATGANKHTAEAFAVALWEIIYETDSTWNVSSGHGFRATNVQLASLANTWLSSLTGDSTYYANNLVVAESSCGQNFLTQIPEPATVFLLAVGGILGGWLGKSKRRGSRPAM